MKFDPAGTAVLALHYQNENCHRDGRIRVGIAEDAPWREPMLAAARRLHAGVRAAGLPLVHVRLAVRPDYAEVIPNTPIFRQWIADGAWQEGGWGVEFVDGLEPRDDEIVITHLRNSAFHACELEQVLRRLGARALIVSGVSTAYVVESTVREATDIGYTVTVAHDACSTATIEQHENALAAMRLLADIRSVDDIVASLTASAGERA